MIMCSYGIEPFNLDIRWLARVRWRRSEALGMRRLVSRMSSFGRSDIVAEAAMAGVGRQKWQCHGVW